jgi:ADP-ribose pyrophosphatase YjhB (NUDIX family)
MSQPRHNVDEHQPTPRIRVAPIIVQDEQILLVRHEKNGAAYWLLPGGGVDYGESVGDALIREVKEETNLDVELGELVLVNDSIPPDRHRHVVNLYFTANVTGGTLRMGTDWNLAEVKWVPFEQVSSLTFYPDIREALLPALQHGFANHAQYLGNLWS